MANVNPSPRARFQESASNISRHRDMIASTEFQRACDFAMLQYQGELAMQKSDNFNTHAANQMKIVGALEFMHIFRHLGEQAQPAPKVVDRDNLSHSV